MPLGVTHSTQFNQFNTFQFNSIQFKIEPDDGRLMLTPGGTDSQDKMPSMMLGFIHTIIRKIRLPIRIGSKRKATDAVILVFFKGHFSAQRRCCLNEQSRDGSSSRQGRNLSKNSCARPSHRRPLASYTATNLYCNYCPHQRLIVR